VLDGGVGLDAPHYGCGVLHWSRESSTNHGDLSDGCAKSLTSLSDVLVDGQGW
jgi:hypothetical protein